MSQVGHGLAQLKSHALWHTPFWQTPPSQTTPMHAVSTQVPFMHVPPSHTTPAQAVSVHEPFTQVPPSQTTPTHAGATHVVDAVSQTWPTAHVFEPHVATHWLLTHAWVESHVMLPQAPAPVHAPAAHAWPVGHTTP